MFHSFLKDLKKHRRQYFILFAGLFLGGAGFFGLAGFPLWRVLAVFLTALFYFLWGVVYHLINKDLHIKLVLEYFFIALIGGGLLLSIILRG